MKTTTLFVLSCLILILGCAKSENEILDKTISKLESLKSIEYEVTNHDVIKDMGRDRIDKALCYFDFSSNDTLIGAKYQFVHSNGEQVFNGKQEFSSMDKERVVLHNDNPNKRQLSSSIFMSFSILELKKLLPELQADTTISITRKKDTIINGTECYKLDIQIPNRYIGLGSNLTETEDTSIDSFDYFLMVSKKDYLPIQFGMINVGNNGFRTASFSHYRTVTRNDSVWGYRRFPDGHLRFTYDDYYNRMRTKNSNKIGQNAPEWTLNNTEDEPIKLSELKSDLVLLEFWFPYCPGCVLAVPDLNGLQDKYSKQGLSIYGIEFTNSKKDYLVKYLEEQKVGYPTLYMGKEIAEKYGVYAAPTLYLLDDKGAIIYTSVGMNKKELTNAIEKHLSI